MKEKPAVLVANTDRKAGSIEKSETIKEEDSAPKTPPVPEQTNEPEIKTKVEAPVESVRESQQTENSEIAALKSTDQYVESLFNRVASPREIVMPDPPKSLP